MVKLDIPKFLNYPPSFLFLYLEKLVISPGFFL